MARAKRKPASKKTQARETRAKTVGLRVIGGTHRGRKLQYAGDTRVRPMKDRVREAIFNLVGPSIRGKYVLDLFAGTGAIGLEALSRGASGATFLECHYPTANVLKANIGTLGVEQDCRVVVTDTFAWLAQQTSLGETSLAVFVSPPYEFFISRPEDMSRLVETVFNLAPPESILVVESDQRFDFALFAGPYEWDIRDYAPARVAIARKPSPPIPNP